MRQLEGVRSSKIYHCHLSKEAMEYFFVLRMSRRLGLKVRMVKALVLTKVR